ncbi:hypothetical protein Tco_1032650 [Tanacetum coccineum]|uniref:Retrovirus-related Pol polyprotein from transposon TNT 1-94 n=1 Tax=Tanacetum coccineum TaxID=301880 RepID=A0ABQ5GD90_9ASTR
MSIRLPVEVIWKSEDKGLLATPMWFLHGCDASSLRMGYVFRFLNGGVVDWKSIKQSIFATSSNEAEYIAAYDASKEVVWIRKFISALGIVSTIEEPIKMYYNNTGALPHN